jgi:hypothetical protein
MRTSGPNELMALLHWGPHHTITIYPQLTLPRQSRCCSRSLADRG